MPLSARTTRFRFPPYFPTREYYHSMMHIPHDLCVQPTDRLSITLIVSGRRGCPGGGRSPPCFSCPRLPEKKESHECHDRVFNRGLPITWLSPCPRLKSTLGSGDSPRLRPRLSEVADSSVVLGFGLGLLDLDKRLRALATVFARSRDGVSLDELRCFEGADSLREVRAAQAERLRQLAA